MNSDRELMQMALDALELSPARYIAASIKHDEATKALRHRLAQPEPEKIGYWNAVEGWVELPELEDEQKPFCWVYSEGFEALKEGKCWTTYGTKQDDECKFPLYTAPPPQEFVCSTGLCHYKNKPEQWVGLTEEEFSDLLYFDGLLNHVEVPLIADLIRAVQAKLKEKNT